MVVTDMAAATTARGLLMPSLRPMPLLRLSVDMAAMAVAMAVTDMAAATTVRGRLRLSPATATATVVDTAMVATDMVVMVAMATARGLLSPAMAMAAMVATAMAGATVAMAATATAGAMATGVSYHRIRRSEL